MRWSPDDVDRLERAIVDGDRVRLLRRGTEYVVVPLEVRAQGTRDVLVATTNTGDDRSFVLDEIEWFDVIM
ncbi:MAG TPA: hypothetical protein VFL93_04835 [Longimicrobiaceae bacterium]|nr:hypothetical protein [Longimicrobiaceae bacterium]